MARTSLDRHFEAFRASGDMLALAEVFDEVAPELLRVARHLASPSVEAHDLVQTTFLVAIQRVGAWDPERPVKQWLLGILAKEAAYERRRGARVVEPDRLDERSPEGPVVAASDHEFARALDRALDELPEKYREVVRPVLVEGMSPRDVARTVGQRPGTVRVQLHRGLRLLRELLPAGFALGALVSTQSPGMAAVRAKVLVSGAARGGAGAVGATSAAAAALGLLARLETARGRLAVAGALGALVAGGLFLADAPAPEGARPKQETQLTRSVATAAESGPALGGRGLGRSAVAPTGILSPEASAEIDVVQVTGRVLGPGLQPAFGASVELDVAGAGLFRGETDGQGDFRIPVVLGGEGTWAGAVRARTASAGEVRSLVLHPRQREAHLGTLQLGAASPVRVRARGPGRARPGRGRRRAGVDALRGARGSRHAGRRPRPHRRRRHTRAPLRSAGPARAPRPLRRPRR